MLPPVWHWLDTHPPAYWYPAILSTALLLWQAWSASALPETPSWRSRWIFPLTILLMFVAWRWPLMIANYELNPDESQFIAGALTLRHDPVFWRSVDGMTSGPLVSYVLVPVLWLGLPLDFMAARCVGLIALWLVFAVSYRQLLAHYNRRAASLGVATAAFLFAATTNADFNHYSSELVPIALLAITSALLIRPAMMAGSNATLFAGSFCAGLTPWAKLQSAPIAAAIVLISLVRIIANRTLSTPLKRKALWAILGGSLLPAALALVAIGRSGELMDFYRSYLVQNLFYTTPNLHVFLQGSPYLQPNFSVIGYALVIAGAVALAGGACWSLRQQGRSCWSTPLPAGVILLIVSIACVLFPGRDFLHYTFLLLPALLLMTGSALGECGPDTRPGQPWERIALRVMVVTFGLVALLRLGSSAPPLWGHLAENSRHPRSELGNLVRTLSAARPSLAVWGWQHEVYVEARTRQATRSAYTYWEIVNSPQRDYFRARYLSDFTVNRPTVFVDAVGDYTYFFGNRAAAAHETFPELAALVARDYCLVAELRYARVYARRDWLVQGRFTQARLWQAILAGHPSDYLDDAENQDLNQIALPKDKFDGRFVMMLRPPATARWTLKGDEREFRFGYGYKPEAIDQPEGNGTEFTVALTAPDGTKRTLRSFLYDPAHHPEQRDHRNLRLLLPPSLVPGTILSLTTDAGPDGNNAWDWAYADEVGFLHAPGFLPVQFPAFNRPPDSIDAPEAHITNRERDPELLLHAPATLRFRLKGHERSLQFTYGFREGAYRNGSTNGAIFRILLFAPGQPSRSIFTRTLDPLHTTADQGEQRTELELPTLPPDTTLEITIDPDGNNAWDWTYISSLRLG